MSHAHVRATWVGERRFDAGRPDGPTSRLDGSGQTGQSPVDGMLSALAGCAGVDVVEILAKRRTPVERFVIDVVAERAEAVPGRVVGIEFRATIDGPNIERVQAERAIDLSLTKYCSVRSSLDPAISIVLTLTLNGEPGPVIKAGSIAGA
jgi:putative redox protein